MRNLALFLILVVTLFGGNLSAEPPRLLAQNGQFIGPSGQTVVLRGINWAEPWTCRMQDMAEVKSWGVNVVRVWCNEKSILREFGKAPGKPDFRIAQVSEWARTNDVYLILVLGDMSDGPTNETRPWRDVTVKNRMQIVWDLVAKATWNNPAVLGYEFMNEPPISVFDPEDYSRFVDEVATNVRFVARNTTIIVPGPTGLVLWDEPYPFKVDLPNIAYSYTFWDPYVFTHASPEPLPWPEGSYNMDWLRQQLQKLVSARQALNAPVILSEFGATYYALGNAEIKWVDQITALMNKDDISGMYWSYKSYRAKSFHIYYNEVDRQIPLRLDKWDEMLGVLKPWWQTNSFPAKQQKKNSNSILLRVQ